MLPTCRAWLLCDVVYFRDWQPFTLLEFTDASFGFLTITVIYLSEVISSPITRRLTVFPHLSQHNG